jgi:pilus assembly protein CpaE
MTSSKTPIRVVAIGDFGPIYEQITSALSNQQEFLLADMLTTDERLLREAHASEPDIILVDHMLAGKSTLDIIDDLAIQNPEAAIVAILPDDDPVKAQQIMLAGARAFIVQPFTQVNLLSTLRRVRELESRRVSVQSSQSPSGKETTRPVRTIALFSPRGGAGCSTLAANLALALMESSDSNVLLLEGKLFFGHLGVMLNIRSKNSLADLIPHASLIDEGLVRDVVTMHASGLHVLLAPSNVQVAQGIRPDDLYNVFMGVQKFYDYVIIDIGSSLNENSVTLMDACDKLVLVTVPDMASLRDTSQFIQVGHSLAYSNEKMLVALNRVGINGGLRLKDVEAALHHLIFAQIPDDDANALRSLNRGVPIYIKYPRSPVTKAVRTLAKSINELSIAESGGSVSEPMMDRIHQEALLASSRLG